MFIHGLSVSAALRGLFFLLIVFLLAFTHRLSVSAVLGGLYFLLFFWAAARDRASTLYIYDSFPGYCLALANACVGGLFLLWLRESRDNEADSDKKEFYFKLGLTYSWWFLRYVHNFWQAVTPDMHGVSIVYCALLLSLFWAVWR